MYAARAGCWLQAIVKLKQKKRVEKQSYDQISPHHYRICRNKRPGRLIFRSTKKHSKTHRFHVLPPLKNHPSKAIGFMYSPFEKSSIKAHRFYVLPPLKNHSSKAIGFVYSPLWEITHQKPSVLCTPPFEKSLFLVGAYFDKYGIL